MLRGRVVRLLPNRVYAPRRLHAPLQESTEGTEGTPDALPRYRATLKFGRRGEPWLACIEPMRSKES